jgi:hypothetical protein
LAAADALSAPAWGEGAGMRYSVFILAAALAAAPLAARADVTIVSETVSAKGGAGPRTLYLTADQVKVDTPKIAIIFQIAAGKITAIMKEKKEYFELDAKTISAATTGAAALVNQKLQGVPEAQRKMIEALMTKHGAMPGAPIQMTYEKSGESKTIGAWPCDVYHQKKDDKRVADLCVAKADALGLTEADLAPLRALAHAITKSLPESMSRNAAVIDFEEQTKQIGYAGVPVEAVLYLKDIVLSTTTVRSVDHAEIAPETFAIPAGFAKKDVPGLAALRFIAAPK